MKNLDSPKDDSSLLSTLSLPLEEHDSDSKATAAAAMMMMRMMMMMVTVVDNNTSNDSSDDAEQQEAAATSTASASIATSTASASITASASTTACASTTSTITAAPSRRDVFYNDLPASHFDIGLYVMSNEALLAKKQQEPLKDALSKEGIDEIDNNNDNNSDNNNTALKRRLHRRRAMSIQHSTKQSTVQQHHYEMSHNSAGSLETNIDFPSYMLKHQTCAATTTAATAAAATTTTTAANSAATTPTTNNKTKKRRSKSIERAKKHHADNDRECKHQGIQKKLHGGVRRSMATTCVDDDENEAATVVASNTTNTKYRSNSLADDEQLLMLLLKTNNNSAAKISKTNRRSSNERLVDVLGSKKNALTVESSTNRRCRSSPSPPPAVGFQTTAKQQNNNNMVKRRRSMDYFVSTRTNNTTSHRHVEWSPSPPFISSRITNDYDDVRFSPTKEMPRRRSMDYAAARCEKQRAFGNNSTVSVRASEKVHRRSVQQPKRLRRRSRSIELNVEPRSSNHTAQDDDGLKATSQRRSRSIDMSTTITTSSLQDNMDGNCSREFLLAESGDDCMPLRTSTSSGTTSSSNGGGFLSNHHKIPRRRGVDLVKAFSFRRNKKKFESLPDQGSDCELSCDTINNSDASSKTYSSNSSRPISKQMSLRNLVDRRNSNISERIGSASTPGTPLASINGNAMKSTDRTIRNQFGGERSSSSNKVAPIASISCIQLSVAGEAVMTQLIEADFSMM